MSGRPRLIKNKCNFFPVAQLLWGCLTFEGRITVNQTFKYQAICLNLLEFSNVRCCVQRVKVWLCAKINVHSCASLEITLCLWRAWLTVFVDSRELLSDVEVALMFSSRERLEGNSLGLVSAASHLICFILSLWVTLLRSVFIACGTRRFRWILNWMDSQLLSTVKRINKRQ